MRVLPTNGCAPEVQQKGAGSGSAQLPPNRQPRPCSIPVNLFESESTCLVRFTFRWYLCHTTLATRLLVSNTQLRQSSKQQHSEQNEGDPHLVNDEPLHHVVPAERQLPQLLRVLEVDHLHNKAVHGSSSRRNHQEHEAPKQKQQLHRRQQLALAAAADASEAEEVENGSSCGWKRSCSSSCGGMGCGSGYSTSCTVPPLPT